MNEHATQLSNYIQQSLALGTPESTIRQNLQHNGWDPASIDQAFAAATQGKHVPAEQQFAGHPGTSQATQHAESEAYGVQQHSQYFDHSTPPAGVNQKYGVFQALGDSVQAMKANPSAFLLSTIVSHIIAVGLIFGGSLLIGAFLLTHLYAIGFGGSMAKLAAAIGVGLVLVAILYAVIFSLVDTFISLALNDGAENRRSNIGVLLGTGFKRIGRVILANILFALAAYGPLMLVLLAPTLFLSAPTLRASGALMPLISLILMLVGTVWTIIALLRFALTPFVALFEPETPVTKTLGRSKQLLGRNGQWFLFKGFLLYIAITIILSVFNGNSVQNLGDTENPIVIILLVVTNVLATGALAMLYRNRRLQNR